VAIAQAGNGASSSPQAPAQAQSNEQPGVESNAPENSAKDPDNVQYTAPGDADYKGAAASNKSTVANPAAAGKSSAGKSADEAPGTEQSAASEQSEGPEQPGQESGSETANDDGPGGHADEPGNPNADHQFQGQE
jgi:hypothetical protein